MKSIKITMLLGALALLLNTGCDNSKKVTPPDNEYEVPTVYDFENLAYPGQTVRLLLLKDLTSLIAEAQDRRVSEAELLAVYENTDEKYSEIATNKNLSGKVAESVDTLVRNWFKELDTLSANGTFVTSDNRDLKQLIEKYLMGGVLYYQATAIYLEDVLTDDNSNPTPGRGTDMEHHWDEAFGYFGAARDYSNQTDETRINPGTSDANGDGEIDPESEQNFYYAITAAKRDVGSAGMDAASQTNFTESVFGAFVQGRAAISNNDFTTRDKTRSTILNNWEALIAATAVHYAVEVKADLKSGSEDLAKLWAELKGYTSMLQHNPSRVISNDEYETIMFRIGDNPSSATAEKMDQILQTFKSVYGFTDQQISEW